VAGCWSPGAGDIRHQ